MLESAYQNKLIRKLKRQYPGCIILKNDSSYIQGIPDLSIFQGPCWATLEVKASYDSEEQPNQRYYVDLMNEMSFSSFIFPENEKEVLHHLQQSFKS